MRAAQPVAGVTALLSLLLAVSGCADSGVAPGPISARDPQPCPPGEQLVCHDQNASRLGKQKLSSDRWCVCETIPVAGTPDILDR